MFFQPTAKTGEKVCKMVISWEQTVCFPLLLSGLYLSLGSEEDRKVTKFLNIYVNQKYSLKFLSSFVFFFFPMAYCSEV